MLFGVGKGREPVLAAEVVVELVAHARIVGDEGDDDLPVVERLVDLVEHVLRCVGVVGIDQHDDLAVADAADDFAGVGLSGQDVARGDPAGDAVLFQRVAERIGQLFVNGALNRDYSLVLSLTILVGALTILFNAIVDVLYAVIDPKIRY